MPRHGTLARMHGCMVALVDIDNVAHQYSRVVFENDRVPKKDPGLVLRMDPQMGPELINFGASTLI